MTSVEVSVSAEVMCRRLLTEGRDFGWNDVSDQSQAGELCHSRVLIV